MAYQQLQVYRFYACYNKHLQLKILCMVFINNTLVMSSMNSGVFNTYEFAPTLVPYYPVV